ncbi:thaumatin family protein [Streptomyces sp. CA-111067]|uniref:thaumatin family protein n=1 Tax=Streptomyces sp. CA-111067 TaxID=3240046 RepID=UPI003D9547FD
MSESRLSRRRRQRSRRRRARTFSVAAAAAVVTCLAVVAAVLLIRGGPEDAAADRPPTSASASAAAASRPAPVPSASATAARGTATASPSASAPPSATASPTRSATSASTPRKPPPPTHKGSAAAPGKRTVTLVNRLSQTIWPAIAADPKHPVGATGWVLTPGASVSFTVPDHWDVRVWARTGCHFDAAGNGHCVTGDCGHFQCGSTWGEFPSTLAEFNLNAWNGMDFYDVSLVEGNNLPMWINSFHGSSRDKLDANGCSAAGCTRDANATCPAQLQRVRGGKIVACLSACLVFKTDQTCCNGAFAARPQCVPSSWPVDSAAVFKKAEPFAYSYVNDDATSVLTCSGECGYRITWGVSP